jgi:hypothetical protein
MEDMADMAKEGKERGNSPDEEQNPKGRRKIYIGFWRDK